MGELPELEWEQRLWAVERWVPHLRRLNAVAFRAGGSVAALLAQAPPTQYELMLDAPVGISGGPITPAWERRQSLSLEHASDVVGVSPDGRSWFLLADSGVVISVDVGGSRELVTRLGTRASLRTGCVTSSLRSIAYLDASRPDTVFVRALDTLASGRLAFAKAIPAGYVDGRAVKWEELRFGGSLGGPCVLWAPRMHTVMLVSDSTIRALGPFVEPVPEDRWYHAVWRWITRTPAPVYTMDATSFPGGVALLFAGRTNGAARLVDLYADSGAYLETLVLPEPAMRVAGNRERLLVLRQHRDSVLLASYFFPPRIRATIRRVPAPRLPGTADTLLKAPLPPR